MASMLGTDAADLVTRIEPRRHLILPTAADNEDDIQAWGGGGVHSWSRRRSTIFVVSCISGTMVLS
jgi:hypothetical protein